MTEERVERIAQEGRGEFSILDIAAEVGLERIDAQEVRRALDEERGDHLLEESDAGE